MFKTILLLGLLVVAIIGLPLTIIFSHQKQITSSNASNATTILSLIPQPGTGSAIQKNVHETVPVDLWVNPGTNAVTVLRVQVKYDPTKLELDTSTPFTPANKFTFIQSPVATNGLLSFVISVGSDPNQAIQMPTPAGTFHFKALNGTNGTPTVIAFTDQTQVLSVGVQDQASENVLATPNPAEITIIGTSTNQEPTATITPTSSPTPPVTTITPSTTPTTSSTPPTGSSLSVTILLHSIGNSGDNVNPDAFSLSNKEPKTQPRSVTVSLYNSTTAQLVETHTTDFSYNGDLGNFKGTILLNTDLPDDTYFIKVKTNNFLQRKITGFYHIAPGTQLTLPVVTLVAGDANGDNKTNIFDYNLLIGCYSDFQPAIKCDDTKKAQTDFNDDGFVNQTDINLFLREITVQNGD